jgi:hypothetical protein
MASSSSNEVVMIDGLKLTMKGGDLIQRIEARIVHHDGEVKRLKAELSRGASDHTADHPLLPASDVKKSMEEHRRRLASLRLIMGYLLTGETYLVNESDLRFADLWPNPNEQEASE